MPQLRAEQILNLTLKDLQIANDANIKQHKIENWQSDPSGWISKGIIKPVTTAQLPIWNGEQAGQIYYDINTNELFIGITTAPYYQLVAGAGIGDGSSDRLIIVKMSYEAQNWSGVDQNDISGTASVFALDTNKVTADGSNLTVYLNGLLQERGSGNDYIIYEEGGVDKIQFNYNLEGPEQKITAIVNMDAKLVNYATKAYVDDKFYGDTAHDHDGIDSNRLDFNIAMTSASLSSIIHTIKPNSNAVNLGSPTQKFGHIYAEEGHFDANTIWIGNVALSGSDDTLKISKDGGSSYIEVPVMGSPAEPTSLTAGTGQTVVLESQEGIVAKGDILPDMTGASGAISVRNIGSPTQKFNSVYADEVFVGASSLYVNGKKVIEDVSNVIEFKTDTDQALAIKTVASVVGSGNANIVIDSGNELNIISYGGVECVVAGSSSKNIVFTNSSTNGNIDFVTESLNGQVQLVSQNTISLSSPSVLITGNLTVSGTTTFVNTTQLEITDNILVLNKNQTGTPISTLTSGLEVERGDSTNYQFLFRELDDTFVIGEPTSLQAVATREDTPTTNAIPFWNNTLKRFDSSGVTVSGSTLTATLSGNASTASSAAKLTTARTIGISGKVTGTATSFDGTGNITISTTAASILSSEVSDATNLSTANMIVKRDASGRAKVVAPSAADDIARKDTVDAVQTNLTTHAGLTAAGTHGSTSAAAGNTLMYRNAAGQAKVAAPSASDDIANKGYVDARLPTGSITMFGGSSAPSGWLLCNGAAVSRTTYAALFTAIGTGFGVGNGTTTFNLPDMREAAPVGVGTKNTGIFSGGAVTLTIASPCVGTLTNHKMATGDAIVFSTTGALPTGLAINTVYYAIVINANTFNLATTLANALAGTKINTSGTQSGTHTLSVNHDVFTLGQFKDDQAQGHKHTAVQCALPNFDDNAPGTGYSYSHDAAVGNISSPTNDGTNGTPRTGTTTRGKRFGINFIIKT